MAVKMFNSYSHPWLKMIPPFPCSLDIVKYQLMNARVLLLFAIYRTGQYGGPLFPRIFHTRQKWQATAGTKF